MTLQTRILGSLSIAFAVLAISLQAATVALLWATYSEVLSLRTVTVGVIGLASLGLLFAVFGFVTRGKGRAAPAIIGALANLGVLLGGLILFLILGNPGS